MAVRIAIDRRTDQLFGLIEAFVRDVYVHLIERIIIGPWRLGRLLDLQAHPGPGVGIRIARYPRHLGDIFIARQFGGRMHAR